MNIVVDVAMPGVHYITIRNGQNVARFTHFGEKDAADRFAGFASRRFQECMIELQSVAGEPPSTIASAQDAKSGQE